jgi:hypothetical protein
MKDRMRDILIAIIGIVVFPLSLLIEIISWFLRSKADRIEIRKWKKIKKDIIKKNKGKKD